MVTFLALMLSGTLFLGYNDVQKKALINTGLDEQVVLCVSFLGTGLLLAFTFLFVGVPVIREGFWAAAAGTIALNLVSQNLLIRAFSLDDISLISPLRLITPLVVVVTGFLFLREQPSLLGIAGIILSVGGLYFFLFPELRVSRMPGRGVIYGLLAAVLFAFSFPLDKIAVSTSSVLFMTCVVFFAIGFFTTLWNWSRDRSFVTRSYAALRDTPAASLSMVAVGAVGFVLTNQALVYALVAYAASLKRLQALWTVLFAGIRLQEEHTVRRLVAAGVIFAGIVMTVFA